MRDVLPDIPEKVRLNALSRGEAGRAWLSSLNEQVAGYERRWKLCAGRVALGGTESFVVAAKTEDGQDVILKIVMAGTDPDRQELRTLRAADGRGYARLLRCDEAQNVLLLEKLGRQLHEFALPEASVMEIICATLAEAWMPQPEGAPFATGADMTERLAGVIAEKWDALDRPCAERTFATAMTYAARRRQAFDPAQSVLAHGDAHEWNTLAVPGSTTQFKLVDPDGAFAEKAFDLAIPMREWGSTVPAGDLMTLGHARLALICRFTGVEPQAIWEWTLMQLVWNGLLLQEIGADVPARVEFAMADAFAAGGDRVAL